MIMIMIMNICTYVCILRSTSIYKYYSSNTSIRTYHRVLFAPRRDVLVYEVELFHPSVLQLVHSISPLLGVEPIVSVFVEVFADEVVASTCDEHEQERIIMSKLKNTPVNVKD